MIQDNVLVDKGLVCRSFEGKCPGCNDYASTLWKTKDFKGKGLCSECFIQLVYDTKGKLLVHKDF